MTQDESLTLVHFWCAQEACCRGVPLKSDYPECVLPSQVNAVTIDGITPLFNACCSGSAACVNMLLEFGAKAQLGNHLPSPIHEAVKRGDVQGVSRANNSYVSNVPFVVDKALKKKNSLSVQINRLGFFTALGVHLTGVSGCALLCSNSVTALPPQVTGSAWRPFWPTRWTLTKKTSSMGPLSTWLARTRGQTASRSFWS